MSRADGVVSPCLFFLVPTRWGCCSIASPLYQMGLLAGNSSQPRSVHCLPAVPSSCFLLCSPEHWVHGYLRNCFFSSSSCGFAQVTQWVAGGMQASASGWRKDPVLCRVVLSPRMRGFPALLTVWKALMFCWQSSEVATWRRRMIFGVTDTMLGCGCSCFIGKHF